MKKFFPERIEASDGQEYPANRNQMQSHPVIVANDKKNRCIDPKKERWLPIQGTDIECAAMQEFMRHDCIAPFVIDVLRVHHGWQP
jgi:hypothetical protein